MKNFEYAHPHSESEMLAVLRPAPMHTEILGGGTDLIGLMKRMLVSPDRVVNVTDVREMQGISEDPLRGAIRIGASTRLQDVLSDPRLAGLSAVRHAITNLSSVQLRAQMTLGGELCRRPRCWYFRNGCGLLANGGLLVEQGDNRYHAILGDEGPAKFVSSSRLAPALIALGASVRVIGPTAEDEMELPLADLYRIPAGDTEREVVLHSGQVITHVLVPSHPRQSALYEVRHGEGPDDPLVSAAAALQFAAGIVVGAQIVLGQVAPIPWVSQDASRAILGRGISQQTAQAAGQAAVRSATPLSGNIYKVQLAKVAVTRAIMLAAGLSTGGF